MADAAVRRWTGTAWADDGVDGLARIVVGGGPVSPLSMLFLPTTQH